MKLSTVHMVVGLFLIVALSFYFNQGEGFSVPHVVPFELEKLANTKEPFASQPAPPALSAPSALPALSALPAPSAPPALPALSAQPVVSLSDAGYQAMTLKQRADMLNQIQRLVRDEIRMARQLETLKEEKEENEEQEQEQEQEQNLSERQGCDYHRRRQEDQGEEYDSSKKHRGPDMTKYIRKDQIPCWGCSLDY